MNNQKASNKERIFLKSLPINSEIISYEHLSGNKFRVIYKYNKEIRSSILNGSFKNDKKWIYKKI